MNSTTDLNENKIKVGAVSYLNTKPLVYGLHQGLMKDKVELIYDYPGKIAESLLNNTIDLGLVPVAIIPDMEEYHFAADYCIAADGPVASVCIFSEVPLQEISTLLLDYQSRTSVLLVQYLLKEYWQFSPVFKNAGVNFIDEVKGTTAAVIIGDRAFKQRKISPYIYDLGEAWKAHTGLPFVFAAWVSNKALPATFIAEFNSANQYGIDRIEEVIAANACNDFDLRKYYTHYIQYHLDDPKQKGLQKFLQWCRTLKSSPQPA